MKRLGEGITLHRYKYHTIELVLDRLKAEPDKRSRIAEAVEQALALADGLVAVVRGDAEGERAEDYRILSTQRACPNGHGSIPEMEPRLFSFNSPLGACAVCDGLGTAQSFSEELLVRDASLSLAAGALHVITDEGRLVCGHLDVTHFQQVGESFKFDVHTPLPRRGGVPALETIVEKAMQKDRETSTSMCVAPCHRRLLRQQSRRPVTSRAQPRDLAWPRRDGVGCRRAAG